MVLGEGGKGGKKGEICNSVNNNKIIALEFISNKSDISSFYGDIPGSCILSAFLLHASKVPSVFSKNLFFSVLVCKLQDEGIAHVLFTIVFRGLEQPHTL